MPVKLQTILQVLCYRLYRRDETEDGQNLGSVSRDFASRAEQDRVRVTFESGVPDS